jgi:spore coat protein CotH
VNTTVKTEAQLILELSQQVYEIAKEMLAIRARLEKLECPQPSMTETETNEQKEG